MHGIQNRQREGGGAAWARTAFYGEPCTMLVVRDLRRKLDMSRWQGKYLKEPTPQLKTFLKCAYGVIRNTGRAWDGRSQQRGSSVSPDDFVHSTNIYHVPPM